MSSREDLNVTRMIKNHKLARSMVDMGFGEPCRQLEYKVAQRGKTLVVMHQWYPSTKICSLRGDNMAKMLLTIREWTCPSCQAHHDRDINAAIH
jgi:putative transposase